MPEDRKNMWNWTLTIGSTLVPFMFGLLFTSMVQGMPIDAEGNMSAHFGDYVNLFSVVGGIAFNFALLLTWIELYCTKTTGPIRDRARNYASAFYGVLYFGLVAFAALLYFKTDFFEKHFASTLLLLIVIVALTLIANISVFKGKEMVAFIASGLTMVALVGLLFSGLFPRVLISSIDPSYDLLIAEASSSHYTLKIMSYLSLTILPFVLAYTAWTYYIFRKRISHTELTEGY